MEPKVVQIPDLVHRVGRTDSLLHFSEIRPEDAALRTAGNRYDVPGGAVLYASTHVAGCFGETLGRFRPSIRMRRLLEDEKGHMLPGQVPQDWRLRRAIVDIATMEALPFLDVDAPETQEHLSEVLAPQLLALGYADNLDISHIRNSDRRLSRLIALTAYNEVDEDGTFKYSGIRYRSRVCDEWECWAIFDGTETEIVASRPIVCTDPDLTRVASMWGLRVF